MSNAELSQEKLVYNAKELSAVMGLSTASTYNLMRQKGFPTILAGRRLLVAKSALRTWLDRNNNFAANN